MKPKIIRSEELKEKNHGATKQQLLIAGSGFFSPC